MNYLAVNNSDVEKFREMLTRTGRKNNLVNCVIGQEPQHDVFSSGVSRETGVHLFVPFVFPSAADRAVIMLQEEAARENIRAAVVTMEPALLHVSLKEDLVQRIQHNAAKAL